MPRFRRDDGRTSWVFCIEVDGERLITRQGRVGQPLRERTIACADPTTAQRRCAVLVRERLAEGFTPEASARQRADELRASPKLEAALGRAPADPETRLVYADWLLSHGDPLGDLVLTELEWERTGEPRLLGRLGRLRRQCAGDLADRRDLKLHWWSGTVHKLTVRHVPTVLPQLASILGRSALRTVGVFEICTDPRTQGPLRAIIEALGRLAPPSVHTVQLRHRVPTSAPPLARPRTLARLRPLTALPAFDSVWLTVPAGHLVALPMDRLRQFGLSVVASEFVPRLQARTWPALERLVLEGQFADPVLTRELLHGLPRLDAPHLKRLVLRRFTVPHRALAALLRSPLGRQLDELDLTVSTVDRGRLRRLATRNPHVRSIVRVDRSTRVAATAL